MYLSWAGLVATSSSGTREFREEIKRQAVKKLLRSIDHYYKRIGTWPNVIKLNPDDYATGLNVDGMRMVKGSGIARGSYWIGWDESCA